MTAPARSTLRSALLGLCLLPLAALPAGAETVRTDVGGVPVRGELRVPDGADLAQGAVLLVHGSLQHSGQEIMTALQDRLGDAGVPTLAITLSLGVPDRTGPFDCTQPHRHRHEDAVGEIAAWVSWLKGRGAGRLAVLGHSRGGNQVAHFLTRGGDQGLAGAVLVAPPTGLNTEEAAPLLKLADGRPDAELVAVPRFLVCPEGQASAAAIRSYYGDPDRLDTPSLLTDAKVPVLVVAADEDTVVPNLPERMEALAVPGVTHVVIEQADHFFRDFAADDLADVVLGFLESVKVPAR